MILRNRIRQRMSIDTINKNVIDPKRRELRTIVADIIKTIDGVRLLGYRITPVDPEEKFKLTHVDYLEKTKNKEALYLDLSDDVIDNMEIYYLLNEDKISQKYLDVSKANTKRDIYSIPELDWKDTKLYEEIKSYDSTFMWTNDEATQENMFVKINLYVPRLKNNVIRLNGNNYFNKYYLQEAIALTTKGKMKFDHIASGFSYFSINTNEIFTFEIYKKEYNAFLFVDDMETFFPEFRELLLDECAPEQRERIDKALSNTVDHLLELTTEGLEDYEDIMNHVKESEVMEAGYRYVRALKGVVEEDTLSLHTALIYLLRIKLKTALKLPKSIKKGVKLNEYKKKLKLNPGLLISIIKNTNQFKLDKPSNEIDIYNFFNYGTSIGNGDESIRVDRKFSKKHLGVIDPIGTSTSENIGKAGMLTFSVPDEKIL